MKLKYLCLISLAVLISLISFSVQKYENSNLKKFLSNLGLPDVPLSNQFLDEQDSPSDNDTYPSNDTDDGASENETETEEEPEDDKTEEETKEEEQPAEEEEGQEADDGDEKEKKTYVNIKCLWVDKYNVYTLQKLQNKKKDYEKEFEEGKVIFNFCQDTVTNSTLESTVLWERNFTYKNETELIRASGSIDGENKDKNEWDELNEDEGPGLIITLAHGEKCTKDKYHKTYLKIYCDAEIDDDDFLDSVDLSDFYIKGNDCKHYISARSIYGCALNDWYLLKRLMDRYKYLFGLGFILIGVFLCMWGNKFKVPTIMLVMGLIFCYVVSIIVLNFLPSLIDTEKKLFYLLGAGFLLGTFVGYLIKAKITIFTIMLGISMGYSVAEVIYQFVQGFIEWNPTYLYYATIVVCCVVGIVIGYYLIKTVMILGTSIVGGYIVMRGAAVIFGNYIDEDQFVDLIKSGEYEQIRDMKNGWVYAYLGLWLVMIIFGFYYQCIGHKKKEATSKEIEKK